jgi:hypothetical protein
MNAGVEVAVAGGGVGVGGTASKTVSVSRLLGEQLSSMALTLILPLANIRTS